MRPRRAVLLGLLAAPAASLLAIAALLLLLSGAAQQRCGDDGALAGDFSGPGALGGVAGTGLTAAQVRAVRTGSPYAGTQVTAGEYLTTAYGPPWGGIQGAGITTSGGLAIGGGAPRWYVIAVDPQLISHGTLVQVWPNPFGWHGAFLAADTGGAIQGRRIDFYDWRGRLAQYRWGHRQADAERASPRLPVDDASGCEGDGPSPGSLPLPGARGRVVVGPLANAIGRPLRPELIAFVETVAGIAGRDLVLTTGTNHSERTVSGNISDHVLGLAGDFGSVANGFPIGGGFGTNLAAAALRRGRRRCHGTAARGRRRGPQRQPRRLARAGHLAHGRPLRPRPHRPAPRLRLLRRPDLLPVTARVLSLSIAAVLASVGAASLAGGSTTQTAIRPKSERPSPTPIAPRPASAVLPLARAYALAARTWSADTFERAWRREVELAAGSYRRALLQSRPTRAQLAALRADAAASTATVVRITSTVTDARARVVVELDEHTRSGGLAVAGITRNEIRLRRVASRWRVVGFSALPGESS
jgi:3D (Asp-Asp-Asp) domain-containing protein